MLHTQQNTLRSILLAPIKWLYTGVMYLRNRFYDVYYRPMPLCTPPLIGVGNLTVGGSGKTPLIAYLVHLLQGRGLVGVLSRGYRRQSKGFRLAQPQDTATTLGDEPYQLYSQWGRHGRVLVAVAEKRRVGIEQLVAHEPNLQAILLDDAFQHRQVRPQLQILLTTFHRPFFTDTLLPVGRLREPKHEAKRADVVLVTQCPVRLRTQQKQFFKQAIQRYCTPSTPIFFTRIHYGKPMPIWETAAFSKHLLLVTGIADATALLRYTKQTYQVWQHVAFRDHHPFTQRDFQKIRAAFRAIPRTEKCLLTTEKDWARLVQHPDRALLQSIPAFYLPITVEFLEKKAIFDQLIVDTLCL